MRTRLVVVAALVACIVAASLPARAAVINVPPGVGTLQAAINAASSGDVLQLAASAPGDPGTWYAGAVSVNKTLKVLGQLGTRIDAGCADAIGVDVAADAVQLARVVISGGTTDGLRVMGRTRVHLRSIAVLDTCGAGGAGIDLDAVQKLSLYNVRSDGFPVGTRVSNLAAGARVRLVLCGCKGAPAGDMTDGVLVSNVGPKALKLDKCQTGYASDAGLLLQSADGVRVRRSLFIGVGVASLSRGIVTDVASDDNRFEHNLLRDDQTDVVDGGVSNCWLRNQNPSGFPLTGNASTAGCP